MAIRGGTHVGIVHRRPTQGTARAPRRHDLGSLGTQCNGLWGVHDRRECRSLRFRILNIMRSQPEAASGLIESYCEATDLEINRRLRGKAPGEAQHTPRTCIAPPPRRIEMLLDHQAECLELFLLDPQ